MTVDGRRAKISEGSSPVGYSIGKGGSVRVLPAGERPTCT
jgi:hypothetical protein